MKKYPSLNIIINDKYVLLEEKKEIQVFLEISPVIREDITNFIQIYSLEDNLVIHKEDKTYLSFDNKGVSTVCFSYIYEDEKLFEEIDFVVYDSFFKDNYLLHFIPEIDKINTSTNIPLKVLFDTLFEFVDILDGYAYGIENIKDPLKTKSKFLKSLFFEKGFDFIDYDNEFDKLDLITYKVYKNLLNNLEKILEIRGTETAYELFFGILGYNVEIFEYWFNADGNLIEFNKTYPELSTFDVYSPLGFRLNDEEELALLKEDPRFYISSGNPKNILNKSNFIRVKYYKNINLPEGFLKSKKLISHYLEWLRPKHVRYLTEIYQMDIISEDVDLSFEYEFDLTLYEGEGEDPYVPPLLERIFKSTTGKIKFKDGAIYSEFPIMTYGGIININGEALISSNYITYESDGVKIKIDGTYSYNEYISETGKIILKNSASASIVSSGFQTLGPLIDWRDFLTQENRDNWEAGYLRGSRSPAEFFAMDFRTSDKTKTYYDELFVTREISLLEEVKATPQFDSEGLNWDEFFFDQSMFFLEDVGSPTDNRFHRRFTPQNINLLKNNYNFYKDSNARFEGESLADYEKRIQKMLIKDFYQDFFISVEIMNNLLN